MKLYVLRKWLPALVALCCLAGLAGCRSSESAKGASSPEVKDTSPVIAEINGVPEHSAAFERFVKSHLSDIYSQTSQGQPGGSDELRSRLFDEFIKRQLIVHEAQKSGITASQEEIARTVQEQRQQTKAEGPNQEAATLTSNERAEEITSELLTLKYYQQEVLKDVKVTPEEVERYYEQNKTRYQKNGFYVREIRVEKKDEAEQLHQKALARPADFSTLAREHSKAPNSAQGGLMYYEVGQLPPVLEQEILPLKVGGTSRVIQSNYGFHIFRLENRTEPLPFDKLKKKIEEELLSRKNQDVIDAFNERALGSAQIKIHHDRLGFNYAGNLKQAKNGS
ncbi:MAG TPA: peptidyl-prolyl cis-trans isomerase [Blastocatellia bacterium]|nr:peptidyl-prolyl cis-trans isomerase [Blastocatellia bacterium]